MDAHGAPSSIALALKEKQDMKSRGIAAGASVIVLALTAAGQSTAAGLGDIAPKVDAEAGTGVDANVQLGGVKTQVTLDAYQWSASHGASVGHGTAAAGGVKVKGDGSGVPSVGEHQTGHLDGPARPGRSDRTQVKRGHSSVN